MADPFGFAAMPGAAPTSFYQQPPSQYPQQQQQQAPPPQQQQQQQQQQPQYQQQQQQPQYQQPAPQAFEAPPTPQQQQQQLVVATQPSNPYAGMVTPQPSHQQQPQFNPWDSAPANLNSSFVAPPPVRSSTASAASFDPFATPLPAPAPVPQQQQQQQQAYPSPAPAAQDPWAAAAAARDPWGAPAPAPTPQQHYPAPAPLQQQPPPPPMYSQPPYQAQEHTQKSAYSNQSSYGQQQPQQHQQQSSSRQMVPAPPSSVVVRGNKGDDCHKNQKTRNPYSNMLSQQVAGSNCSALPKAELVGKRGFVLSRISFRTIVMKKWKQSFWIQYGGHTMLWFRSQGDFDDWLNNPYHTQSQRNFLIKLAINFVHDLYKPNVRGYQVTQCRTKPYGNNKAVRQFKLERWMDYGPTIAAAFGSYDSKEVDACREAIVECMKNTPLDNGIRATGAVKEHHDRKQEEEWRKAQEERQLQFAREKPAGQPNAVGGGGARYQNYTLGANGTDSGRAQRAPSFDLMGNSNKVGLDDSASVPPYFGDAGARALVPAVNPNAAYPGAPPVPPAFYPSAAPPQQQQQPHSNPLQAPEPSPYGAPAPQGYPGQHHHQQQQQQQQQYPPQAPAPAFAQQAPTPAFAQQAPAPSYAQQAGGYPQQQQQQQQPGGYPVGSYPVPTQQY